ncbi:MAG: hypothetical protein ABSB71_09380 [Candidatus Bathyarchaeia archaeon]
MKAPSKKEILKETEKMQKIYDCYRFLFTNTEDEKLRMKIEDLAREHIVLMTNELKYSVALPIQNKLRELEDELKKAKERENRKEK